MRSFSAPSQTSTYICWAQRRKSYNIITINNLGVVISKYCFIVKIKKNPRRKSYDYYISFKPPPPRYVGSDMNLTGIHLIHICITCYRYLHYFKYTIECRVENNNIKNRTG